MSYIFNRIKKITQSYLRDDDDPLRYDSNDELKRIIDELNSESEKENKEYNNRHNSNDEINIDMAYNILKIDSRSSIDEIKSAYKQRIKEYHPARLENFGEELKLMAIKKTQEINSAYAFIREERNF